MQFTSQGAAVAAAPLQRRAAALAIAALLGTAGTAQAFDIDTGNPDLAIRWDNTVRYNLGARMQSQDSKILGNPNFDDGDRNFSNGSLVTNRFDVLSEFDLVWQRKYGFRVSAAGWYDFAYRSLDNTNNATANTLVDGLPVAGVLSPYTKRYAKGASGEILDAFVFANFDAGDVPINVKAGQHTVYWGDSLLLGGAIHGVSYGQNPLDVWKGFATPGSEAKELFRPRGGITLQAQPLKDLSVAGQWFYNWQADRIPESGSYLTIQDPLNFGGDSFIFGPNPLAAANPAAPAFLRLWRTQDIKPPTTSSSLNDWGLSARWSPDWLDGTLGFYYRNTNDVFPQAMATPGVAAVPAAACSARGGQPLPGGTLCFINPNATTVADLQKFGKLGTYNGAYGDNIHIYGITAAKEIGGVSFGAELSYRQNMPLVSDPVQVLPAAFVPLVPGSIATTDVPTKGTPGALGDTWHGLINALNVFPKTALFDTATLAGELTWMRWEKVTQNEAVFKGRSNYSAIDKPSRNFFGLAINFTPTWFQVWPGVDLLAPVTWSQGISGNSAVAFGGSEDGGNWSAGIAADIYQKYRIDLKYNGYYGNYSTDPTGLTPAGGVMGVPNGANASLSDRGWVSLTFKTTF
ncbi:MAG TPA: DUF1302 domain-containing protein [Vicinamibacterales bacterium]